MISINLKDIEILPGHPTFVWEGKLIKLESMPSWLEKRKDYDLNVKIQSEKDGSDFARCLGVYTPKVEIEKIELVRRNSVFHTRAIVMDFLPADAFSSTAQICLAVPNICCRLDWQYIVLCDILIGNWNRSGKNLLYDRARDVIIPIGYDAFSWDIVTMDSDGIAKVTNEFLCLPTLSGIFGVNLFLFDQVRRYIYKNVEFEIMKAINNDAGRRVIQRAIALTSAMKQFINYFDIGRVKASNAVEIEACLNQT